MRSFRKILLNGFIDFEAGLFFVFFSFCVCFHNHVRYPEKEFLSNNYFRLIRLILVHDWKHNNSFSRTISRRFAKCCFLNRKASQEGRMFLRCRDKWAFHELLYVEDQETV